MTRSKHPLHDRLMEFDVSRNRFLPKGFVADRLKIPRPPEEVMREYKAAILKNMRAVKPSTTQLVDETPG